MERLLPDAENDGIILHVLFQELHLSPVESLWICESQACLRAPELLVGVDVRVPPIRGSSTQHVLLPRPCADTPQSFRSGAPQNLEVPCLLHLDANLADGRYLEHRLATIPFLLL